MNRLAILLLTSVLFSVSNVHAQDTAEQAKAAMIKKIDALFGQRYTVSAELRRSIAIQSALEGPEWHDALIYWHGANHVAVFGFATDGTLKRVDLFPEEWLYSSSHTDNPDVELSASQMNWLVEIADRLQPVGKLQNKLSPRFCFESGGNRYCGDQYENASVGYWRYEPDRQSWRYALKSISINYERPKPEKNALHAPTTL